MNQLEISDEGVAEQIVELCEQINEGIWNDESEILEMFKEIFEKLNEQKQKTALVYIKTNQSTQIYVKKLELQFLNTETLSPLVEEVIDYKNIYKQLTHQNIDWQQLINLLKQKEFCEQNNINPVIINNFEIIQKLKVKIFSLLNLSELTQIKEFGYPYLKMFKILLGFIEKDNDLDESEAKKFEMIIGALLEKQIMQFLEYEDNLFQSENSEMIKKIIFAIQQEGKQYQDFSNELCSLTFDQKMFIKICTIQTKEKALENIRKQISLLFYCENLKWEQKLEMKNIDQNILKYHGFESLYFSIIFYFWQQYCYQKYGELNQFQINLKKLTKIEYKSRLIKGFISKAKENSQDQIYLFMIHHSIQFSSEKTEYIDKEKIQNYYEFQQNNFNQICKVFESKIENILQTDLYCQLNNLRFIPLFNLKKIIQQKKQNQNVDQILGKEQNDINLDTQIQQNQSIKKCQQDIINQCIETNLTEQQHFIIQLLFQNPQREFCNQTNKDLVLKFIFQQSDDIHTYINEIIKQEQNLSFGEVVLLLELLSPKFEKNIISIIKLYKLNQSLKLIGAVFCLIQFFTYNQQLEGKQEKLQIKESLSLSVELIKQLLYVNEKELLSLKILFGKNKFQILLVAIVNQYLISEIKAKTQYMKILKKLVPICPGKYHVSIQTFRILFLSLRPGLLNYLFSLSKKQEITQEVFKKTLIIIFTIMVNKNEQISKFILSNLHYFFTQPCYDFDQIWRTRQRQVMDKHNFKYNLIKFLNSRNLNKSLVEECFSLFKENPQFYQENLGKVNYFKNIQIHSVYFLQKNIFDQCPLDGCFTLEDFNISLTETSSQQEKKIVQDWMDNIKDTQKFKSLIPFFFNIIKRGESSKKLLSIITTFKNQNRESIKIISNMKALFQLFYNNSNDELKVMLLKLYQNMYPVPLIFQNPSLQTAKEEIDLYGFNEKLYYVFQTSFPIINFSLSQKQAQIGKTELINQLFYQQDKFETQDTCQLNNNTIDIMFDTQFNGSRNFSVADAHGQFPIELLVKILPLFQMWILQFDSEYELIENYTKLKQIKNILPKINYKICFIIRNYKGELEENAINEEFKKNLEQLKKEGIKVHKIIDLAQKGLDKSLKEQEFQLAQSFIFNEITTGNQQQSLVTNQDFLGIIQKFDSKEKKISHQFLQDQSIIKDLENELNRLIQKPLGFYDQEAFPIRSIEYQLKILKEKENQLIQQKNNSSQSQSQLCTTKNQKEIEKNQDNEEYKETKQQIIKLEDSIKNSQLSNLLKMFCKIFDQSSYYILYLQFTDQVRKFNERNTYELQEKNQIINEKLMKLKKDRDQIKLKKNEINQEASSIINYDGKNKVYKKQQDELKQELKQNLENIAFRNIGIEMFWRELIAINQRSLATIQIDPADKVYEMIKKGEPFEFLDGDSLKINGKFLDELKNKFTNLGKEKVLVLSVLGPQSSGKSTILNKIFGCHFWTSVGRCTKGIYLNLLKIQFKEYFNNLFDYILILDSEGLQNPNQIDPEFDKKIALFVLAISDIVLINVKGDIHQQFKNLVEMCIFTLVSMKSNLSSIKQLSWCFNQNNDANNFAPFLNQIQGIANSLNLEYNNEQDAKNQTIDYNEFLNISKENIQILGFACIEKLWRKNENLGITKDWRQLIINETFSEEAYLYGIRMIKNFMIKFESQTDTSQMQSLSLFIQNINTNWQTICNLPDLLEFAELIQYKQDQLMKNKFEQIYAQQDFSFKNEIGNEINDRIRSSPVKNLTLFYQIQDNKNEDLRIRFSQIEQDIQDKLLAFKQDKQIQKKIYLKYLKQLSQLINSSLKDSEVIVFEEIKNIEREYQNKRGFKSLDDFILEISKDPDQLAQFKENEGQITAAFDKLWGEITNESEQKQSEILKEYSTKQYQCISSSFNEYKLTTQNEQQYISSFLENINNNSPFRQDLDERMQIYQIFEKELFSQVQFRPIINTKETMRYGEIFHQNLEDRMKRPKTKYDVMDINKYYQFQIKVYYVEKKTLDAYIKKDKKEGLISDLIQILEKSENNQGQPKGRSKQFQSDQCVQQCLDVNSFSQQYESTNSQFQQYENINPQIQQYVNANTQIQQNMNVNTQNQQYLNVNTQNQQYLNVNTQNQQYLNANTQNQQYLNVNTQNQQYLNANTQIQQNMNVNTQNQQYLNVNTQNQQYLNVNSQVSKLLLLLDLFNIDYDQKLRQELLKTIQDPSKWKIWSSYNQQVINAFEKFQDSCKEFIKQKQHLLDQTNDTFIKNIKEYNKGLKLNTTQFIFSTEKEVQEVIQHFEHIIVYRDMAIIPNSRRYYQLESSLKYIQRKESSFQENFRLNFIKGFETAMFEENQKQLQNENCQYNGFSKFEKLNSWQMMYFSIYDVIKSEMTKSHQENDKKDNSDSEEISQQNTSLIKIIMSKIEQEIINYNKSFANFGIILSGIGERCIYYYSMLIIWRFTCYKKGKGVQESIQKFESLKQNQLQKFIADIKQNKTEQSKLKAEAFISNFYNSYIQHFYRENQTTFGTEIQNKNKMTSTELIKLLDKAILEDYQEDMKLKKYTDKQIVQYITDQTSFIENYVKNEVDKIEVEIKDLFENKLRKNLNLILEKVNANVQQLRSHTDIQNPPIKSKEYFVNNENDNSNDEFYESKLFDLIISCLLGGQQKMNKFQIQKEYEEIFSIDSYQKIEVNIFDKSKFQESELQIQLLQPFATELSKQLNIHIQKAKNETLSLEKFNSYQELQTIKLNMIGCRHTCPMCKRKCDQSYSNDHKHKCSNGHQLRGMNGVLIENTPSLFTCDEMDDECLIVTLETKVTKKWKEIRKIYDDWIFKGLDEIDQQTIKEKMMKVWNQGTGQMVCEQLKTLLKKDIKFVLKNNFQDVIRQPKIHYIFMLDDSGSMKGKRWEYAKSGCLGCMLEISKNLNARVSVIIFNYYARTVINCESVNLVEMEKKIQLSGGGTNFEKAFQETYNLIIQHQNDAFEKTEILFYTDGGADYPKQLKQFKELPEHQKNRIFLHCSSEESNAITLQMIVNELNASLIKSELIQKFQVTELQKTWAEVVSREYHNLKG